jgi:pimeloyl-ACP methyl ester carboxylesterase
MPYVTVGRENSGDIDLYYEDHGSGQPVVLIHGWPLSGRAWEKQVPALLDGGFRVITYDRRGFGDSSKPVSGYDYDTLAADLQALLRKLDLHDSTLVGFSMGGGEVARYLRIYGTVRVSKAVFIAAIPPFLPKSDDNPKGVDPGGFDEIKKALNADRPQFLTGFFSKFYNVDALGGRAISDEAVRLSWNIASGASPKGTSDCVSAWLTDFRSDLAVVDVPTLVIHGDADQILPIAATGERIHEAVKGSQFVVIEGGPHGLTWTHAERVNAALLEFLGKR